MSSKGKSGKSTKNKSKNTKTGSDNAKDAIVIEDDQVPETAANENESDNENENESEHKEQSNDTEAEQDNEEDEEGSESGNEIENDKESDKKEAKSGFGNGKTKGISKSKLNARRMRARTKTRDNRYRVYLFKVLQQVHPKFGITKTAMDIVNSFMEDMFERICVESMKLCQYHKTNTIGAREIATAAKLILPGELMKHAILEGEKAVEKYEKTSKALQSKREKIRAESQK